MRELGNHTAITIDDAFVMYEEMLTYVQHDCYGSLAKAQIYPKIVFYMYRQLMPYIEQHQEQQDRLLQRLLVVVNRGIRFLQQQEVAYYLFELLESKIYLMQALSEHLVGRNGNEKRSKWDALQTQAVEWKETLQNIYTEYGISYRTKDCCYLYHEKKVYSLGETIAKRRKLLGFTQEALCDGICAKKTLVRLEKGEGKTQTKIVMQLLKRLHLIGEYLHRLIITDKRELLDTFDQFKYEVNMGEYELAEELLSELRKTIEKNTLNEQTLKMSEQILLFYTKKIDSEEYVQKMKEVLQYTVPLHSASKGKEEFYLTDSEEMLVYHIAIGYKWAENYDKAYEVLHQLEKVYAKYAEEKLVDSHIGMYEFIMVVVANLHLCREEYEKAVEL
ncbi:MAG: helix-turn-helix transcriptional regulator, partial [Clostridia bacterium]|nr:helix-turn-helix transcriptional regulator [Clostridia bacterium]